jgi:ankyrin repeat protein
MWAAAEGHTEAVKLLISRGALTDVRSTVFDFTNLRPKAGSVGMNFPRGGFTPLLFAARQGHMETVRALVDAGADLNLPEPDGTTALVMSIINFHYDIASYLMDKGADVNAADIRGRSALYAAVDQKNLDISNRPPAKVEDKNTPETLMRQLIAKGANPNAALIKSLAPRAVLDGGDGTMGAGATPFLRAARAGDVETMKYLLANKANLNATTAAGANAMLIAAGMGWRDGKTNAPDANSVAAIQYLASLGMSVNSTATSGETPMHSAGGRGSDLVVETLAKLGGNVNAKDKAGRTPYDIATGAGAGIGGVRTPQESTMALLVKLGGGPAEKPAQ